MADDDRAVHADRVEHRDQIPGVRVQARGACESVAAAAAAKIGRDHTGIRQALRHERPGEVGCRHPVDEQHRGRGIRRPAPVAEPRRRIPQADAQVATVHGDVDGAVATHRAVHPPSIVYEAPVTIPALSDTSQPTSEATSSGSMSRLIAFSVSSTFSSTSSSGMPCTRA